ncbi:copper amine oxidase N-terminal domain-containing protein [Paenibacillus sp. MER 99-2]|uniref:copper amine oxidase N-terminal domain-containing protein n=1 Tax=Paenibacillus sp. MER 99-2 TaxID=2939572 RepID=UPI00203CD077|nr:copper amine oxidase N-terminal domain-containing protein [Paenibacillus sp. MER 99-2]MCM3172356.1 copper amine oxidase N-terminal domain-containing protein [Paenibacillus sp. MER 99-2]
MNKKVLVTSVLSLFLLTSATSVFAHPGRTDSNGGHTCWTNCSKWGLEYGQYHYHNGGSSSSSSSSSSKSSGSSSSSSSKKTTPAKPKETKPQYTESSLKVYVNDQKVDFTNKPVQYQGSNLLPLRDIADALDATFTYDPDTAKIGLTKDKFKVTLTIGSKTVFYNGKAVTLSTAPKVVNGVTYIPVQSIKGLGATLQLNASKNTLNIEI